MISIVPSAIDLNPDLMQRSKVDSLGNRLSIQQGGADRALTINRGIADLRAGNVAAGTSIRRPGGGRKAAVVHQPKLLAALETLIEDAIRGDPCSPLRWVSRSQRHLVKALTAQGFKVSQRLVGALLRELKYSCQANRKTREGSNHPDRDAQFGHINATVKAAIADRQPA
ncbi:MAG: ISAzo13-like element transposase-related protein, partial [Thiomonas sp.]